MKQPSGISVTSPSITTDCNRSLPSNAQSPMEVTPAGTTIEVISVPVKTARRNFGHSGGNSERRQAGTFQNPLSQSSNRRGIFTFFQCSTHCKGGITDSFQSFRQGHFFQGRVVAKSHTFVKKPMPAWVVRLCRFRRGRELPVR